MRGTLAGCALVALILGSLSGGLTAITVYGAAEAAKPPPGWGKARPCETPDDIAQSDLFGPCVKLT